MSCRFAFPLTRTLLPLIVGLLFCLCLISFAKDNASAQRASLAQEKDPIKLLEDADKRLAAGRKNNNDTEIGTAFQYRGRALRLAGRMKEAGESFLEAVTIWDKLHVDDRRVAARGAAANVFAKIDPDRSSALVKVAFRIAETNSNDPLANAQALHDLGTTAETMGLAAMSEAYFNHGITIRQKLDPNSADVADTLAMEGRFFREHGDFIHAIGFMRRALAVFEQLDNKQQISYSCYSLGGWALQLGDLPIAEFYDRRGIALEEARDPNGQLIRWMLGDRAAVLSWRGEYEEAESLLQRVIEMQPLSTINPPQSTYPEKVYMDLGSVYLEQGKIAEGEQSLRKAEEIIQQADLNTPKIWHYPDYLLNDRLGDLAMKKGDMATAAAKYEEAYKPFSGYDEVNPVNILILIKLATANEKLARHTQADEEITLALRESQDLAPDSAMMATALFAAAEILYNRHDISGAEKRYQEAWNIMQRQVDALTSDQARLGSSASASDFAEPLIRAQIEAGHLETAFLTLEQSRAQTLRKLLTERHLTTALQPSHQMEVYRLALTAQSVASQILTEAVSVEVTSRARLTGITKSAQVPGVSQDKAADIAVQQSSAKANLDEAIKSLAAARLAAASTRLEVDKAWAGVQKNDRLLFAEPIAMKQARESLPPGVLYIAFSSSLHETTVFLVEGSGSVQTYSIKIELNDLNDRITEFRKLVSQRTSSEASIAKLGRDLFQTLFPAEAAAQLGRAGHLLISPDGPLWDIPFSALVVNASGPPVYLGLAKPMAFTQSLTVYALLGIQSVPASATLTGKPLKVAVVGDPIFSTQGSAQSIDPASKSNQPLERSYLWGGKNPPDRLPGTRTEATQIAALYHGVALLGADATEAALRQILASADVIHLATHSFTNPANPLASGILLTPPAQPAVGAGQKPPDSRNDGALQASEIFGEIRLRADLAVLSGCETGVGKKVHGEGVIGLTRALQYAGVRSIVASQWKVADAGTGGLMVGFHQKLIAGVVKDEALRGAMQAVQSQKETSHPSYWAAFFLTGDAGPLRVAAQNTAH